MIEIKYNKKQRQIECKGHAGYAPQGQDVVCAAVSAIMRMVCFAAVDESPRHDVQIGDNVISVKLKRHEGGKAEAVLECAAANLAEIALEYPNHTCMFRN